MDAHHRLISSMHQLAIAPLCYKFKNLKAKSLLFQLISVKKLSTLNLIFLSLENTNYSKGLNHLVLINFSICIFKIYLCWTSMFFLETKHLLLRMLQLFNPLYYTKYETNINFVLLICEKIKTM